MPNKVSMLASCPLRSPAVLAAAAATASVFRVEDVGFLYCRLQPWPSRKHSNLRLCPTAVLRVLIYPLNEIDFDGCVL